MKKNPHTHTRTQAQAQAQVQKYRKPSPIQAFTLIEVMVSVSIFLIVMVISMGAVLAIVDGNKKTQAINSVSNNLSSAIESMVRDIKTGYAYTCGRPAVPLPTLTYDTGEDTCSPETQVTQDQITFISTISGDKRTVRYELIEFGNYKFSIFKTFCPASIPAAECTRDKYETIPITSPDVDIQKLEFRIRRPVPPREVTAEYEYGQPSVFIFIKGTAYVNPTQTSDFSMQTFVSQRVLGI